MGDLEQVDPGQAPRQDDRVDLLLDVAGQQEALAAERAQEDDRHVVDRGAAVGRIPGNRVAVRPQDPEVDRVQPQSVARRQEARCPGFERKVGPKGAIGRARADHARLVHLADPVRLDEARQPTRVILVGMAQDQDVDASVPRRDARIELEDQAVGIGTPVDQHPGAAIALDKDRVALSDVEDRDMDPAVGPGLEAGARDGQGQDKVGQDGHHRASRSP